MTTYGAYDAGLPCKNKNCKSHGKPHPNCKCYSGLAEGGGVEPFCSKNRMHDEKCALHSKESVHTDPVHSVASYLIHGGLHGFLKMGEDSQDDDIARYDYSVKRGKKFAEDRTNALFDGSKLPAHDHSKAKKAIDEWVTRGGVNDDIQEETYKQHDNSQAFAKGGDVKHKSGGIGHHHGLAETYPEHNMMLHEAKGRISNYLNSLRPQGHTPRLAFDDEPDNRKQKKSYNTALDFAAHPLKIVDEIHKGTIEPEHVTHFKNLHPEVDDMVQKQLTNKIIESQLSGKKPPRHVRQGMSLLMGTPLSGELSPQGMMAAQAVFQKQGPSPEQAPGQPKKNAAALKTVGQDYMLPNQAAAARQQKQ